MKPRYMRQALIALLPVLVASQFNVAVASAYSASAKFGQVQPMVSLAASASREVEQDRTILTFSREQRGKDAQQLADEVNRAVNAVLEAAKANEKLSARSGSYAIWPQYEYDSRGKQSGEPFYTVRAEVIVTTADRLEATQFVEQVSEQMNLSSIDFDLSQSAREAVENDIRAEAIKSFQSKASAVAREFGFEGYELTQIQVEDSHHMRSPQPRMSMMRTAQAEEAMDFSGPQFEAGKAQVTVRVSGEIFLR